MLDPADSKSFLSLKQDVDRLRHYGQVYGEEATRDTYDSRSINLAAFFGDDAEANTQVNMLIYSIILNVLKLVSYYANTQLVMNAFALEKSYEEYRSTGVHRIKLDIPEKTVEVNWIF